MGTSSGKGSRYGTVILGSSDSGLGKPFADQIEAGFRTIRIYYQN
jgi:hypothetical protein